MTPISFKAKYINPVEIQKYDGKEYKSETAAFVELDYIDSSIIKAVNNKWNSKLVEGIYNSFAAKSNLKHVFAVTTQIDSFERLNPDKVLGMALFEKYNKSNLFSEITFFQVAPEYLSIQYGNTNLTKLKEYFLKILHKNKKNEPVPKYQHIGKALIKSIQKIYNNERIALFALPKAEKFYKKWDFINPAYI